MRWALMSIRGPNRFTRATLGLAVAMARTIAATSVRMLHPRRTALGSSPGAVCRLDLGGDHRFAPARRTRLSSLQPTRGRPPRPRPPRAHRLTSLPRQRYKGGIGPSHPPPRPPHPPHAVLPTHHLYPCEITAEASSTTRPLATMADCRPGCICEITRKAPGRFGPDLISPGTPSLAQAR
jgi:hypothetical protein